MPKIIPRTTLKRERERESKRERERERVCLTQVNSRGDAVSEKRE